MTDWTPTVDCTPPVAPTPLVTPRKAVSSPSGWLPYRRNTTTKGRTDMTDTAAPFRAIDRELAPETTQPNEDWEDCDACFEVEDMCRFHRGVLAGHAALREAVEAMPDMTVRELLERIERDAT